MSILKKTWVQVVLFLVVLLVIAGIISTYQV